MTTLLEQHAEELRVRIAILADGLNDATSDTELCAAAHKLRGSALVLGLDGLAVATAAYEAALATPTARDEPAARRAAALAALELDRALDPDLLRPLRHDLRNDLNVVLMGSKLLEVEVDDPEHVEIAANVASAAERMNARLVELRLPERVEAPRVLSPVADAGLAVLVVDDDELVANVVRRMLDATGARVDVATGLGEARNALAGGRDYAVVVVDLRLADGDGAELVPELAARGIRIVVLSGEGGRTVAGAHVVLAKPVESSVLIAAVTGNEPPA